MSCIPVYDLKNMNRNFIKKGGKEENSIKNLDSRFRGF